MRRPCLRCGELTNGSWCPDHQPVKASPKERGYGYQWQKLSKQCRKLQPWCSTCNSPGTQQNPLTLHHTPDAWSKVQAGKHLSMRDAYAGLVSVECQRCNNDKGPAR